MQGGGDAVNRAPALDESLARAHQLAVAQGHGTVALEHLLFALTEDADAVAILNASRISVDQLRTDVSGHLGRMSETAPPDAGAAPRPGADLLRILQLAGMAARQSQRRLMDGGIVLAAIIGDGNSPAAGLLKSHGLTFEDVIRVLQTAPRQPEIPAPNARAELPAPSQTLSPAPPPPPQPNAPVREAPRPTSGDDALAAARARVKQSEPAAMTPLATASPPAKPVVAEPAPRSTVTTEPAARPASPPQDLRPSTSGTPEPRVAHRSAPTQSNSAHTDVPRQDLQHQAPSSGSLSEPPPGYREVASPMARHEPSRPEIGRLEPARPRLPSLPADPITVPVSTPESDQQLARLRPSAPMPAPPPDQPGQTPYTPQPPQHLRPMAPSQPSRQVPMVAPRPVAPYPSLPPPGPRPPMPQRADLPPLPPQVAPPAPMQLPPPPHTLLPAERLEIVHAAAGLPAVVRRNVPVLVEIRIPRAQVDVPRNGLQAPHNGGTVVRAVTTRLTGGPVSGLSIEPRTPETTWLGPGDADSRDVIWQYVLLPTRAGTFAVTLSVAGRTFSPGGMLNDTSTAAETFAVRVKPERGRFWRRSLGTLVLLGIGGAVGWALTGPLAGLIKALIEVARG